VAVPFWKVKTLFCCFKWLQFKVAFFSLEIASGIALAMTEPTDNREEVGRWQGGYSALPSANLFHIKMKECHCDPDEARDWEKQSLKIYTQL
jgi:hypothetical protein